MTENNSEEIAADSLDLTENTTESEDQNETVETVEDLEKYAQVNTIWNNIILGSVFMCTAFFFVRLYNENPRFTIFMLILLLLIHGFVTLLRRVPEQPSKDPLEWIYGITGTWLPILILSISQINDVAAINAGEYEMPVENPILIVWQIFSILFLMITLINLGSSYGVVPARRPLKTRFIYGLVRHPLYFGYALACFLAVLQNPTPLIATLFALMIGVHVLCIRSEEEVMSNDPFYAAYKANTRKKLIPFVW